MVCEMYIILMYYFIVGFVIQVGNFLFCRLFIRANTYEPHLYVKGVTVYTSVNTPLVEGVGDILS